MRLGLFAAVLALLALPSNADPLPKGAKPLSAKQITQLFAGNSQLWETSKAYFSPDGTVIGVYGKPPTSTYAGKWTVKKNKICMTNLPTNIKTGKTADRTYTDCWIFYTDGTNVWSSYSNDYEDGKGPNEDFWDEELKTLKKGDQVSGLYKKYTG
jgi:hypothetical protein